MSTVESIITSVGGVFDRIGTAGLIWILLAPLLLLLLILVPIFLFRGYKKGLYLSLVSLGATIVSYFIAVLLAKPFSILIARAIFRSAASSVDGTTGDALQNSEYLSSFLSGLLTAAVAMVIFLILFIIFLLLSKILLGVFLKEKLKTDETDKVKKFSGMGVRIFDAILLSFLVFVPFYALIGSSATALSNLTTELTSGKYSSVEFSDKEEYEKCLEATDASAQAMNSMLPVKVSGRSFIGFSYNYLASFSCKDESYNAYKLLEESATVLSDSMPFVLKNAETFGSYEKDKIDSIVERVTNNSYYGGLLLDVLKDYDNLVNSSEDSESASVVRASFKKISDCTIDDVNKAVVNLGDSLKALIDRQVLKDELSLENVAKSLKDRELASRIDKNIRSSTMLSKLTDFAFTEAFERLKKQEYKDKEAGEKLAKICDNIIDNVNKNPINDDNEIRMESDAFIHMLSGYSELAQDLKNVNEMRISTVNTDAFSDLFLGIALHPYVDVDNAGEIIGIMLPMFGDQAEAIFTDELLASIKSTMADDVNAISAGGESSKLNNLLYSSKKMALAIDKMNSTEENAKADLEGLVGDLLGGMTHESAQVIKQSITGEVVGKLGNDQENSEQISEFVSNLVDNMGQASEESKDEDTKAITEVTSLVMSAQDSVGEEGKTFEEAVGGDTKEFLAMIVESPVMKQTMKDSVYKDGTSQNDPTGGFRNLTKEDKDGIRQACNELVAEHKMTVGERMYIALFFGV